MTNSDRLRYINFNQLRSFYAVARHLNFTKAADWLSIGQPTVTTQVKALEETYNVQLFNRFSRGLELTEAGDALMTVARQIFALEERAFTLLNSTGSVFAGKLHIGTVGPFFVMDLLSELSETYPLIQVSVESGNSDGMYQRLLNYELDIAILGQDYENHNLDQICLGQHEVAVIVDKSHDWAGRETLDLNELDGQRLIFREEGSMTRRALENQLAAKDIRPNIVMELSRDSVVEAVVAGLGAGVISMEEFSNDNRLSLLRFRDNAPITRSYVACLRERLPIIPIQTFMSMAKRRVELSQ